MAVFVCLLISGCAEDTADLKQTIREQNYQIKDLNREIDRLSEELAQFTYAKGGMAEEGLERVKPQVEDKLREELESGDMAVSMQERGLVVTVLDRVLFDSGKAELIDSSRIGLDKMAGILQTDAAGHMVYIEGHTDNVPIRFSNWRSNWELSTARATEVVHYFVDTQGLEPRRFAAVGYGEFNPVASNATPQGRLLNRRVEIVISPKKYSAQAGS
ncbi:MAG TPA: OmpA family protein [bacterium]|nr:OmpA family protein [bacterium]